ncbi:hypothetical protein [Pseudanabaena sp. FACHB-2040]|uniref:hypothetical protein n=1 Tax=Pseudanabaena sp. FACHB-2040 TaxID=2692859 RepID=UPI0016884431|nr:hypothetical protein [Pseudanabaena sp. FACHB-2040]MBD2258241.1 hypothetical protein [Pseudanabaena sp. FACHB-2040]
MPTYEMELWQTHRWQKETRYYICRLEQDLFGQWLISSEWGGLRVGRRRLREELYDTYDLALARLEQVNRKRIRRKYERALW